MRVRAVFISLTVLLTSVLLYGFWPETEPAPLPREIRLAAWVGVTWSMDAHSDHEITALAVDLLEQQVDDAYFYVSYLRAGDVFNATYDHATAFTQRLRTAAPDLRLFAWVGVPIAIEQPDGTFVTNRLHNASVRQQIAQFAAFTITELGFDGFHLNAELIPNDDEGFLRTLGAIRAALPTGTPFSTTAHALRPQQVVTLVPYPQVDHHWTAEYLQKVAQHTDQIALMAYDSGLPFPRDYRSWVRYQTQAAAAALSGTATELLIGLPVSQEWTWSHQTQAETLNSALSGFSSGLSDRINGIALYPYWEMGAEEWQVLARWRRSSLGEHNAPRVQR